MRFRHARRIVHVHRHVALRPAQINRHPHSAFGVGNPLHPMHHVLAALRKLPLELRHQRVRMLRVHLIKRPPRHFRHRRRHQPHRHHQRQRENQK